MRTILLCLVSLALVASEHAWSQLRTLPISGNVRFSEQQLRDALAGDELVLLALQPPLQAPVLLQSAAAALERGYRAHGHPEVRVLVEDGILQVHEGPHLRRGAVVISGVDAELTAWLQKVLTEPYRESDRMPADSGDRNLEDPVWQAGEDAPYHEGGLQALRQRLSWGLNARGYLHASTDVALRAGEATADVHIRVDPGEPVLVQRIVIDGLQRHQRQQVLELLPLGEGDVLSHVLVQQAADALRASAAFLQVTVTLPEERPGELHISVVEHPDLPVLGSEHDTRDALLLAAREDILGLADGTGGLRVQGAVNGADWTLLLVPTQGLDFQLTSAEPLRVLFSGDRWQVQRGDQTRTGSWDLQVFIQLGLTTSADNLDKPRNVSFSAGWSTAAVRRPLDLDLRLDAALLLLDAAEVWQLQEDAEHQILSSEFMRLHFHAGHLQRAESIHPMLSLSLELLPEVVLPDVPETATGADLDLLAGMGQALLRIIPSETWSPGERAAMALLGDISGGMVHLARTLQSAQAAKGDDRFHIPMRMNPEQAADMTQLIRAVLPPLHRMAADVVGIDHWLATVLRDAHGLLAGKPGALRDDLRRLYNDPACGPIGTAVLARLLPVLDANVAELFDERLQHVSNATAFRAEWLPLTAWHPELWLELGRLLLKQEDLPALAGFIEDALQRDLIIERLQAMQESYHVSGELPAEGWWYLAWELLGAPLTTALRPDPSIP